MAQTTTHNHALTELNLTELKANGLSQFLDTFEDEHHHPKSGVLWVVLLAFTVAEVATAFLLPTDNSVKPGQFVVGGQRFAKAIAAEYQADELALRRRGAKEGEFKPDQLALTGRPGHRLMTLMTPKQRGSVRNYAAYQPGDPGSLKAEMAAMDRELAETLTSFLDRKDLFQQDAFKSVNVEMAVQQKLSKHRRDKISLADEFLGEASLEQLNRNLLESAYSNYLRSPSIAISLIFALLICACLKAFIVAVFFMHGRYEGTWLQILIVPSCTLAMVVIVFLSPDIGMVYHTDWALKFLLPGSLAILFSMFWVLQMTKRPDIPQLEPEDH